MPAANRPSSVPTMNLQCARTLPRRMVQIAQARLTSTNAESAWIADHGVAPPKRASLRALKIRNARARNAPLISP